MKTASKISVNKPGTIAVISAIFNLFSLTFTTCEDNAIGIGPDQEISIINITSNGNVIQSTTALFITLSHSIPDLNSDDIQINPHNHIYINKSNIHGQYYFGKFCNECVPR